MKTGAEILFKLRDLKGFHSVDHIVRHVPGKTLKQIQCALTRLVASGQVEFRMGSRNVLGNNKRNREYKFVNFKVKDKRFRF
jgi:hypothetical protein